DVADVDGESMRRAARLVAYFKSHARKVYAVMEIDTKMAAARRLLKWLLENRLEEFTRRDAYREMRGTCKTPEEIDPVLATLEQHGFIRPREDPQARRPGRKPSPVYEVNPLDSGLNGHIGHNWGEDEEGPAENDNCVHCVHCVPCP